MSVLTSSEKNSWYTPPYIIEMVREVLGEIDLDPASHPVPQQWIQAKTFYDLEDDGLHQAWKGSVFLNPPYGKTGQRSNQDIWSNELIHAHRADRVPRAILLTKTVPGYIWWDDLFHGYWPGPCCITYGRIRFIKPEWVTVGYNNSPIIEIPKTAMNSKGKLVKKDWRSKAASTFWYCGPAPAEFKRVFSTIGRVIPRR